MLDQKAEQYLEQLKPSTVVTYRAALQVFSEFYKPHGTIKDFLDRINEDNKRDYVEKQYVAEKTVKDFVAYLQEKNLSPKTIRCYVAAIQGLAQYFFRFAIINTRYVNMPPPVTKSRKHPWTLETVTQFINTFDEPMYRALACLLFQSGLSLREALNLRYGDIAEELEKRITPLCLDFTTTGRRKTGQPFLTFVGKWTCEQLRNYLKWKRIQPEDKLFPVTKEAVDAYFRRQALRFLGQWHGRCPARPHSLRSAFKTILKDSGAIDEKDVEYFMGHKLGDIEKIYTERSIEQWRAIYAKAEPFLTPKA
jgi:integrase